MKTTIRILLVPALLCVALVAAAWSPRLLRGLDTFRVTHVEVLGTRYLPAHEVLAASRITAGVNLFDDPAPWVAALLEHPMIAGARVERRPLSTLVLRIVETEPAAFARTPTLRAVDAHGTVLPLNAAAAELDLPILRLETVPDSAGRITDAGALAALDFLTRIRRMDPDLAARTSEIEPLPSGGLGLRLRAPVGMTVLIPTDVDPHRLERIQLTLADLDAREELHAVRSVDARFKDQVVVSLSPRGRR